MKTRTARNRAATRFATLVLALSLLPATPAIAAESSSYRVTGRAASTWWTQVDGIDVGTSPVGNVHVGWLNANETGKGLAAVHGFIEDWDCEEGELPGWFGGEVIGDEEPGEEPEPEPGCIWIGFRVIESFDVPFTMDKKLQTATLKGRLTVLGGWHGDVVGRPMADIIWTGVGNLASDSYTSRWREAGTWYSNTYRASTRAAGMSGILGPMGFDPELSGGYLASYKESFRSRSR